MGVFDFIQSDKRIIEQKLRRHQLSRQEYQKFLKTIPDEKEEAAEVVVYREGDSRREEKNS